jgi:hypothetical protein
MIKSFEAASDVKIPREIVTCRLGDMAISYTGSKLAQEALGRRAMLGLRRICQDAWKSRSRRKSKSTAVVILDCSLDPAYPGNHTFSGQLRNMMLFFTSTSFRACRSMSYQTVRQRR